MKHISQSTGGASNVLPKASTDAHADKWRILDLLTGCAESFGIGHRELNVLRALLSFLPERIITPGTTVVFPSNTTLSDRLNGLPESTLRRHLARLVASGLVGRHDSPNRKRYARRDRSGSLLRAFGFDLAPLAAAATAIETAAERAEAARAEIAVLRENLALLRNNLLATAPDEHELAEAARRMLRRHASPQDLHNLIAKLEERLSATAIMPPASPALQLSDSDVRNERHQQKPKLKSFDSPSTPVKTNLSTEKLASLPHSSRSEAPPPDLNQLTELCQEALSFFPEATASWQDLSCTADKIAPMMGIPRLVMLKARAAMGWCEAAITVLCLLERFKHIRNPAGYLSHLISQAEQGSFSLAMLLQATRPPSRQIVS